MYTQKLGHTTLKSWIPLDEVFGDEQLSKQVTNVCAMDVIQDFALMPDAHGGYGMPIGGVAALNGAISPYMVGVDIGCGMRAVQTNMTVEEFRASETEILHEVRRSIPVGMGNVRSKPVLVADIEDIECLPKEKVAHIEASLGSLGSGNHFIEFDRDEKGHVWFVIHSGSRNLGQIVAKTYHKLAVEQHNRIPDPDLAYLREGTAEFDSYVNDLKYTQAYAFDNRAVMSEDVLRVMDFPRVFDALDNHHNFAQKVGDTWVHRKGATAAHIGDLVVVPMNMGDGIVIGRGLGSFDSLNSCSHGAGRAMGRNAAKKSLDRETEEKYLSDRGITLVSDGDTLDEMPHAYKDSQTVMDRQSDLVEIVHWLQPLAVVKG